MKTFPDDRRLSYGLRFNKPLSLSSFAVQNIGEDLYEKFFNPPPKLVAPLLGLLTFLGVDMAFSHQLDYSWRLGNTPLICIIMVFHTFFSHQRIKKIRPSVSRLQF